MTKLRITKKSKEVKHRSALYMDQALGEKLEAIAEAEEVSFNRLCIQLITCGLDSYEPAETEAVKKKKRSRK